VPAHRDKLLRWFAAMLAALVLPMSAFGQARLPAVGADAVTSEQVRKTIENAVTFIKGQQHNDGRWGGQPGFNPGGGDMIGDGTTCLAVLALLNAGVAKDDPVIKKGLDAVENISNDQTYVTSIKCQVLAIVANDRPRYKAALQKATGALIKGQLQNGMWTYTTANNGRGAGRGDNSNTQFALLGLHEAARAGVEVPRSVWEASRKHFENSQLNGGGWMYVFMAGRAAGPNADAMATTSMTCAGISSLFICGERLMKPGAPVLHNGVYRDCGKYTQYKPIALGLKWMANAFNDPRRNQANVWDYYTLYAAERVGMIGGVRNFGATDWYRKGAADLVGRQGKDGSWSGGGVIYNDCFALLFLAKGNRPVLIQKLQWDGEWDRNRHDLENFTGALGEKIGKKVTWQTTSLDVSLQDLRQAPILYITGHEFPKFSDDEKKKLRQYVQTGGTLLCDACCGSGEFDKGFRAFIEETFKEYKLRKLDASHPVFNSLNDLKTTYDLHGVDVGCRTGIFYSPKALSPLWELQRAVEDTDKGVTSELAYELGANIAAYATGKEKLGDKLDQVDLPPLPEDAAATVKEIPRGAVRIARLAHSGDYDSDVHCLANVAAMLRDKANIAVVAQEKELKADDPRLFGYPVCFITGHYKFTLTDAQVKALKLYLERGGVLIAEPCCGQKGFEESFRELMKTMFPDNALKELPANHAIYTGAVGVELGEMKYRQLLATELKSRGTTRPPIEAITIKGRVAVMFSKYDFTCGLEGDRPFNCRGYADEDARKLAFNVFLYAISN